MQLGSRRFISAKTTMPVQTSTDLDEDALIQASLDPAVRSIEPYVAPPTLAVIVRQDGRFLLTVIPCGAHLVGSRSIQDAQRGAIPELIVTRAQLRSEPRCSNHRQVWSHKSRRVSIGLRFQILNTLSLRGPMTLGELLSVLRILGGSPGSVFALACADLVELQLTSVPLGQNTPVSYRSEA